MLQHTSSEATLATGESDLHCRFKETLLISDLKPKLNENVGSDEYQLSKVSILSLSFSFLPVASLFLYFLKF